MRAAGADVGCLGKKEAKAEVVGDGAPCGEDEGECVRVRMVVGREGGECGAGAGVCTRGGGGAGRGRGKTMARRDHGSWEREERTVMRVETACGKAMWARAVRRGSDGGGVECDAAGGEGCSSGGDGGEIRQAGEPALEGEEAGGGGSGVERGRGVHIEKKTHLSTRRNIFYVKTSFHSLL